MLLAASLAVPASSASAAPRAENPAAKATANDDGPTVEQALREAAATGKPVDVPAFTTDTDSLEARPNGQLALTQALAPVRKNVDGQWRSLDPTLRRNVDGSWSPMVIPGGLRLSGGGSGPLVTMYAGESSLALSLPLTLPTPTVSGAAATYANIWPGVDLTVTGDQYGSFSEVFVVRTAEAARNSELRSLRWEKQATNLRLTADAAGNLEGRNSSGALIVTAPAPTMWDSRVDTGRDISTDSAGTLVDATSGDPVNSTTGSAGAGAEVAPVRVAVDETGLTLTPDVSLLTSPDTVFPLYIDPGFTAAKKAASGSSTAWTYVASNYPTTSYWKNSELKVGYEGWNTPYFKARSFVTLSLPYSTLNTASISTAELQLTETWAGSCTKSDVDLYRTKPISSATTWNNQPSKIKLAATVNAAKGYSSSCPAGNLKFNVLTIVNDAIKTDKLSSMTVGLYGDESDKTSWKKFSPKVNTSGDYGSLTITYNHAPAAPAASSMTTSPATTCAGGTIIGDKDLKLQVVPTDADHQKVGVGFQLLKNGTQVWHAEDGKGADNYVSSTYSSTTGRYTQAIVTVPKKTLETEAAGKSQDFTWQARVWDGIAESKWGATCKFTFDPTWPLDPEVTPVETSRTVGQAARFDVAGAGATYQVVLNGVAQPTVKADSAGNVRITVVPTRIQNTLKVTAVSAGGNVSVKPYEDTFPADAPSVAADGDLSTDGIPDMTVVGTATGTPKAGLWAAVGDGSVGAFLAGAKNVGSQGTGLSTTGTSADFGGSQAVIGRFRGAPVQDVLVYYPNLATNGDGSSIAAGTGVIIPGNADGTLLPEDPDSVDKFTRDNVRNPEVNLEAPMMVANGGNITGHSANPAGDTGVIPDLIGIAKSDVGTVLEVIPSDGTSAAGYDTGRILHAAANSTDLLSPPVAGTEWSAWKIASAQAAGGTELFLWRPGTAGVWRWSNLSYQDNSDGSAVLTVGSSVQVSSTLAIAATSTVQSVDVNKDDVTDLRVISNAGVATAYLSDTARTALTAQTSQTLTW